MNRRTFIKVLTLTVTAIGLTGVRSFARKPVREQEVAKPSEGWQTYSVIHEKPSFDLPIAPEFDFRKVSIGPSRGERLRISLGSYADGVVYTIYIFENRGRDSIDDFIQRQLRTRKNWDLSRGTKVTLDGVEGKAFTAVEANYGYSQFFSKDERFYQFTALGASSDDPRVRKFFSSISLVGKKESVEISERFQHPGYPISSTPGDAGEIFTPQQVDRKVIVGLFVEPRYTEEARRNDTTGVVILKCLFSTDGRISNISVTQGLPHGLTERAIAAARKLRFVPAMKDGRFVQTWMPVEFYFTLYR